MNSINDRLKYLIETVLGKTVYEFSKSIGNKRPDNLYNNIKENNPTSVSTKTIEKIIETYPNIRKTWLISGEEPIFINESTDKLEKIENEPNTNINQIPMYNLPAAAGEVEVYSNPEDVKIIGYLNIPGAHKESIAIPAYGHSMYPTIANGDWAVSRPISDPTEIVWGEVYYIEWSDYKMYKRLLASDNLDEVILWSDNQLDKIGDRPKYAALSIKKEKIRKLRLVTEILKKPNY
ncbi:S24 family peptidase [Sphingobacterium sp.]|uniref:S24 family peptidase n=1 Tax=Sphingobacterium sp. TaxID=341027 RepID=UPI0028AE5B05|nr:S24 family peptidase [Sphingobacterium sp.]